MICPDGTQAIEDEIPQGEAFTDWSSNGQNVTVNSGVQSTGKG